MTPTGSYTGAGLDSVPIGVVIATRDRPELLRRAVDAVLAQAHGGAIHVVVVYDQAEPDTTLATDAPHRTVEVTTNSRTAGLPGARNTGIALLAGRCELVGFCDDDDMWLPGKLAAQVRRMTASPASGLCTTGIEIDFEGERTPRPSRVTELMTADLIRDRHTEAHPSTFLFRWSALEEVGEVDELIPGGYSEDYDLLLRMARRGPIACVPEPLVSIRWGRSSYFATRWRMIVDAQRYLIAKHPEFEQDRRASARIHGQIAFALAALGERRASAGEAMRVACTWPLEQRWPVALLVACRLVSAERALAIAHRFGRGI